MTPNRPDVDSGSTPDGLESDPNATANGIRARPSRHGSLEASFLAEIRAGSATSCSTPRIERLFPKKPENRRLSKKDREMSTCSVLRGIDRESVTRDSNPSCVCVCEDEFRGLRNGSFATIAQSGRSGPKSRRICLPTQLQAKGRQGAARRISLWHWPPSKSRKHENVRHAPKTEFARLPNLVRDKRFSLRSARTREILTPHFRPDVRPSMRDLLIYILCPEKTSQTRPKSALVLDAGAGAVYACAVLAAHPKLALVSRAVGVVLDASARLGVLARVWRGVRLRGWPQKRGWAGWSRGMRWEASWPPLQPFSSATSVAVSPLLPLTCHFDI